MRLTVISGRSGSGKSTALHVLEDAGFFCIDNLPVSLLPALVNQMQQTASGLQHHPDVAVSIDARNMPAELKRFTEIFQSLNQENMQYMLVYLDASDSVLMQRFSESRRKHPLSDNRKSLAEAIEIEKMVLESIANIADLKIDTTVLGLHDLRDLIKSRVANHPRGLALLIESFGYKHGIPIDADIVFDVRCLPNPHWDPKLRQLTGLNEAVAKFLSDDEMVEQMYQDITQYLERWLPKFEENNRTYMTLAIGCTGGQHRSVYLCERLYNHCHSVYDNVQIRHRELAAK